jgi:hypothetical protein
MSTTTDHQEALPHRVEQHHLATVDDASAALEERLDDEPDGCPDCGRRMFTISGAYFCRACDAAGCADDHHSAIMRPCVPAAVPRTRPAVADDTTTGCAELDQADGDIRERRRLQVMVERRRNAGVR